MKLTRKVLFEKKIHIECSCNFSLIFGEEYNSDYTYSQLVSRKKYDESYTFNLSCHKILPSIDKAIDETFGRIIINGNKLVIEHKIGEKIGNQELYLHEYILKSEK